MGWLRLLVPDDDFERLIFGDRPIVIEEAPGHVVGATEQEVGLFARPALPPPR